MGEIAAWGAWEGGAVISFFTQRGVAELQAQAKRLQGRVGSFLLFVGFISIKMNPIQVLPLT